ncbi:hypothetical protein HaLaN_21928 [Haematococcus lacustris]|uniref:Uncharacterized protein n=1 Tax=Haematococcus lacustris TaxID=44745 RepID=A0A699ZZF6_HAELA|nr:hypothetical protein HaLaN_21928 [Haematococcus lacustris]
MPSLSLCPVGSVALVCFGTRGMSSKRAVRRGWEVGDRWQLLRAPHLAGWQQRLCVEHQEHACTARCLEGGWRIPTTLSTTIEATTGCCRN